MCGRRHLSDHRRRNAVKAGPGSSAVWLYVLQEQNAESYMQADTTGGNCFCENHRDAHTSEPVMPLLKSQKSGQKKSKKSK